VPAGTFHLYRWDEIALEKVTEMVSRKFVTGDRQTLAQIYLKRGAVVPMHTHESEQMTYVLQGTLKLLVAGEEVTLRRVKSCTCLRVAASGGSAGRYVRARRLQPHSPGLARRNERFAPGESPPGRGVDRQRTGGPW